MEGTWNSRCEPSLLFQAGPLFSLWAHNCDMCSSNMPLPSGHIGQPQISTAIQSLVACVHIYCCAGESSQRLLPLDIRCYIWSMFLTSYTGYWNIVTAHTHTHTHTHTVTLIGASLSEPHTSVTSLHTCVCMLACLLACLLGPTAYRKF